MKRRWITPAVFIGLSAVAIVSHWSEWHTESRHRQLLHEAVHGSSAVVTIRELHGSPTNRATVMPLAGAHHRDFAEVIQSLRVIPEPARRIDTGHVLVYSNATHQLEIHLGDDQQGSIAVSAPGESTRITVDRSGALRDFLKGFGYQ